MELTINTSRFEISRNVAENASEASGAQKADGQVSKPLVSTNELAVAGDEFASAVDAIPSETFSREDDLGRLVTSAFNFQAPPMPEFK